MWTLVFVFLATSLAVGPTQAVSRILQSSTQLVEAIAESLGVDSPQRPSPASVAKTPYSRANAVAPASEQPGYPASPIDIDTGLSQAESDEALEPLSTVTESSATSAIARTSDSASGGSDAGRFGTQQSGHRPTATGSITFNERWSPDVARELGSPFVTPDGSLDLQSLILEGPPVGYAFGDDESLSGGDDNADAGSAGPEVFASATRARHVSDEGVSPAAAGISPILSSPAENSPSAPIDGPPLATRVTPDEQTDAFSPLEAQETPDSFSVADAPAADVAAIPEPSTLALLSLGFAVLARRRSRRAAQGR